MIEVSPASNPPPRRVLVVDDSEAERELMAVTLGAAFPGVAVTCNANPMLTRDLCERQAFDCVLLDYNMPEKDGLTLASELRAAFAHLPIILMTSVGDEMLAASALRHGASDYLPKAKVSALSIRRTIDRSIQACGQERLIQEQRGELENFAYALAHDFKQPIRQIITFAGMISEEIAPRSDEVRQHLTFLRDAAGRLGRLVDVMTQYTLLNQPPVLGDFELDSVVASVRASLSPYLAERGAVFDAPSKLPSARGNETLMTQVLQNLVFNGLHYNQKPSPRVELRITWQDEAWVLEVHDDGVGIEPEYLTDIFKPLMRLHNASEYAGTGLGLTLARKAVLAQNGAIWCESRLGEGSVFFVRIPCASGQSDRNGTASAARDVA
jgi:signal transduction histidine kinase